MKNRKCAIVDAYSTSRFLPTEFQEYGIDTVHVRSSPEIPSLFRAHHDPGRYVAEFQLDATGDLDELEQSLKALKLDFIIAGCETGVELADLFSERLGMPTNGSRFSAARRDKSELSSTLGAAGVRSIRQFMSSKASDVAAWKDREGFAEIVIKPTNSAGTEDVYFCSSDAEIKHSVESIVGKRNRLGLLNRVALCQEKIEGDQYTVNAVAIDGNTFVTEAWTYETVRAEGAGSICSVERLLDGQDPIVRELTDYLLEVFAALEIRNGPTHSEIIVASDGPVLVDLGARLQGTMSATARSRALGQNHISATALRYAEPENFLRRMRAQSPFRRKENALCVSLISDTCGTVLGYPGLDSIRSLKSFADAIAFVPIGDRLSVTTDLATTPGIVYLVGQDQEQVAADYGRLRDMRMDEIFELTS